STKVAWTGLIRDSDSPNPAPPIAPAMAMPWRNFFLEIRRLSVVSETGFDKTRPLRFASLDLTRSFSRNHTHTLSAAENWFPSLSKQPGNGYPPGSLDPRWKATCGSFGDPVGSYCGF